MNLNEATKILKENGYRLVEDKYTDIMDSEDDEALVRMKKSFKYETDDILTVDYIDEDNYEDYIGKTVNVKGDVNLSKLGLTKLPIRFIKVGGLFNCSNNYLTTLEGAPKIVGGDFGCNYNKLTSLEGAPRKVGGHFYCYSNKLTDLEGAPREVGGNFDCSYTKITTLEGAPEKVGGWFDCQNNKVQFTEKDVRDYCNVKCKISV